MAAIRALPTASNVVPDDELLQHYTSEDGLRGIVGTGIIRATEFMSLEDSREFMYAWNALMAVVFELLLPRLPTDETDGEPLANKVKRVIAETEQGMLAAAAASDGHGSMYVTSFARGSTTRQHDEGILTLWDRYTRYCGYCVQFRREDVEHIVRNEAMRYSYDFIQVVDVRYGLEESAAELNYLANGLADFFEFQLFQMTHDNRITPKANADYLTSEFGMRLLRYCGGHKHPDYEDEREVRILAYPSTQDRAVFIAGVLGRKDINIADTSKGPRKFIEIGANFVTTSVRGRRVGLPADRIIVGPRAALSVDAVQRQFEHVHRVRKSDIALRL